MKKFMLLLLVVVVMVVAGCSSIAEEYHEKKNLDIMELADKHLPNNVDSTVSRSQLYFIGKYPGTTRYGIFHEKKEVCYIDVGEELTLYGAGKIAYGEKTHHAYVFFYVTSPHFKVKIIEISDVDINSVSEGKAPKVYGVNQNYAVIPKDKTWYSYWGLPDKEVKCPKDFDEIEVYLEP